MAYPNQDVYRFGTDWNVGDYGSVVTESSIMLQVRIILANWSLDEICGTLFIEYGSDLRDYQRLIRETKRANSYTRK